MNFYFSYYLSYLRTFTEMFLNMMVQKNFKIARFESHFLPNFWLNNRPINRPILSVDLADNRYRPISVFAWSVVHYFIMFQNEHFYNSLFQINIMICNSLCKEIIQTSKTLLHIPRWQMVRPQNVTFNFKVQIQPSIISYKRRRLLFFIWWWNYLCRFIIWLRQLWTWAISFGIITQMKWMIMISYCAFVQMICNF